MSNVTNHLYEQDYYYKDIIKDLPAKKNEWEISAQRIGALIVPLMMLYQPIAKPISIGMGGISIVTNLVGSAKAWQKGAYWELAAKSSKAGLAVISFAGFFFRFRLGTIIITTADILKNLVSINRHYRERKFDRIAKDVLKLTATSFYMGLIFYSSLKIELASIVVQATINLYHASKNWKKGKTPETLVQFVVASVRLYEAKQQWNAIRKSASLAEVKAHRAKIEKTVKKYRELAAQQKAGTSPYSYEKIEQPKLGCPDKSRKKEISREKFASDPFCKQVAKKVVINKQAELSHENPQDLHSKIETSPVPQVCVKWDSTTKSTHGRSQSRRRNPLTRLVTGLFKTLIKEKSVNPMLKSMLNMVAPIVAKKQPIPIQEASFNERAQKKNKPLKNPLWFQQIVPSIPREAYKIMPQSNSYQPRKARNKLIKTIDDSFQKLEGRYPTAFLKRFIDDRFAFDQIEMDGLAIVTTYLRNKKGLKGLYVCKSYEAFQQKLEEINRMKGNVRLGLILPWGPDRSLKNDDREYHGEVGHKMAVCVEKSGPQIKIAMLDSLGIEANSFSPIVVNSTDIRVMSNISSDVSGIEAVIWHSFHSSLKRKNIALYFSSLKRQKIGFGCETFAIRDAVTFLQDPLFFDKIITENVLLQQGRFKLPLQKITSLPPAFMKGSQNVEFLHEYISTYPTDPEKENEINTLTQSLAKHTNQVKGKKQNHYINERSGKYHLLVLKALESLEMSDIETNHFRDSFDHTSP
jgi:hypothetical protein